MWTYTFIIYYTQLVMDPWEPHPEQLFNLARDKYS